MNCRQIRIILQSLCLIVFSLNTALGNTQRYGLGKAVIKWDSLCLRSELNVVLSEIDGTLYDSIPYYPIYYLIFPDTIPLSDIVLTLDSSACVIWADSIPIMFDATNDSLYNNQWYLDHQNYDSGSVYAELQVPEAWAIEKGGHRSIRIAIVDNGMPYDSITHTLTHPDLRNFPPDTQFVMRPYPPDQVMANYLSHGAMVTGIIAANTNNGIGIAGIAYNCTILNYKGMHPPRLQDAADPMQGRADIITSSQQGGAGLDYETALGYMSDQSVLCVFVGGNNSNMGLDEVWYPAAYSLQFDNILAVGGTDENDELWHGSPYYAEIGPQINISAPSNN